MAGKLGGRNLNVTMKRWEQLYVELQRKTEKFGYDPPHRIGGDLSQTFEYRRKRKPVLLIAFRDVGLKPDYVRPNRLWVEGLDLVMTRLVEIGRERPAEPLPPAIAIVIDNIGDSYVVVTLTELFDVYWERVEHPRMQGSRQFTFAVERRESGYYLVAPGNEPNVPLLNVGSMDPIVALLKRLAE